MMKRWVVILLIIGLAISGCSPCKRLSRKCPPIISVDTVVQDTTIYRDSLVLRYIQGDSIFIYDSIYVNAGELSYTRVTANTSLSFAEAFIENQKLKLILIQKDSILQFKIDSAFRSNKKIVTVIKTEVRKEKNIPFWYRYIFVALFSLIIGLIIFLILLWKFK